MNFIDGVGTSNTFAVFPDTMPRGKTIHAMEGLFYSVKAGGYYEPTWGSNGSNSNNFWGDWDCAFLDDNGGASTPSLNDYWITNVCLAEGNYRILLNFASSFDRPIVTLYIDGVKVGNSIDMHDYKCVLNGYTSANPGKFTPFTNYTYITGGTHQIKIQITGKNERSGYHANGNAYNGYYCVWRSIHFIENTSYSDFNTIKAIPSVSGTAPPSNVGQYSRGICSTFDQYNRYIYVATATNVYRYHIPTQTWTTIGNITGPGIYCMALHPTTRDLYIGCNNGCVISGVTINGFGRYNVTTATVGNWVTLTSGTTNGAVYSMEIYSDTYMYLAGSFTTFNGVAHQTLVRYDRTTGAFATTQNTGKPATGTESSKFIACAHYNGVIYCLANIANGFCAYNVTGNSWTTGLVTFTNTSIPCSSMFTYDNSIYFCANSEIYRYNIGTSSGASIGSCDAPPSCFALDKVRRRLYVGGGSTTTIIGGTRAPISGALIGGLTTKLAMYDIDAATWSIPFSGTITSNQTVNVIITDTNNDIPNAPFYVFGHFTSPANYGAFVEMSP